MRSGKRTTKGINLDCGSAVPLPLSRKSLAKFSVRSPQFHTHKLLYRATIGFTPSPDRDMSSLLNAQTARTSEPKWKPAYLFAATIEASCSLQQSAKSDARSLRKREVKHDAFNNVEA
eukprot:2281458-Pleurochrysis_carterae.AAC.1